MCISSQSYINENKIVIVIIDLDIIILNEKQDNIRRTLFDFDKEVF